MSGLNSEASHWYVAKEGNDGDPSIPYALRQFAPWSFQFFHHQPEIFMISNRTTSRRKSLGQGMTEYIIIVALIAVAAIGVYSMFGKTVRNQTAAMAQELGGNSGKESNTKATRAAEAGAKDAAGNKNLRDFSGGNDLKGN